MTRQRKKHEYEADAAGRLVKEGNREYQYGWLDKVLQMSEGAEMVRSYSYHMDGQLASASDGRRVETFLWDGLALIRRDGTNYLNEPAVTGGNPVMAGDKVLFNDLLGSTLGAKSAAGYAPSKMTAFGERADTSVFFTGKPQVEGLGYTFLFRNYRPDQGKWQTADPLGYPDGWNNFAYVNNGIIHAIDNNGLWTIQIGFSFSGGGSSGGTVGFGFAMSYYADAGFSAGFYETVGGGSYIGAGGSATLDVTISGNQTIDALRGTAMTIGASVGQGVGAGGEINVPVDLVGMPTDSVTFSVGFSNGPLPFEQHTFLTETFVQELIHAGGEVNRVILE